MTLLWTPDRFRLDHFSTLALQFIPCTFDDKSAKAVSAFAENHFFSF